MIIHVTTWQGQPAQVHFSAETGGTEATTAASTTGPNPIAPEGKELVWGAGSCLVFLILMRLYIFPKLKRGMNARYDGIREDHEYADATRIAARTDVSKYEAELVAIRAEAATRIDAARQTLDAERNARIGEVNTRIAQQRASADAQASAARLAVRDQIAAAVATVAQRTTQIAVGRSPEASVVASAVAKAMEAGAR